MCTWCVSVCVLGVCPCVYLVCVRVCTWCVFMCVLGVCSCVYFELAGARWNIKASEKKTVVTSISAKKPPVTWCYFGYLCYANIFIILSIDMDHNVIISWQLRWKWTIKSEIFWTRYRNSSYVRMCIEVKYCLLARIMIRRVHNCINNNLRYLMIHFLETHIFYMK